MDLNDILKNRRGATDRQIDFATKIAETLDLDLPNFESFMETAEFINDNIEEYNAFVEAMYNGFNDWD